jgi:ubiquinone/menaquinone biosynthesis C-methylase UbiE
MSRSDKAKAFFGNPNTYLSNDAVIRIRKQVINEMLEGRHFSNIADIACGNADISLQFLNGQNQLTLVDISEQMLEEARLKIPINYLENVHIISGNADILELPVSSFDLVISTGLLAHVDSPADTLNKLAGLLKPGGILIIQNTNSSHPYSWLVNLLEQVKWLMGLKAYKFNRIANKTILKLLSNKNFQLKAKYRSIVSLLFIGHFVNSETKFSFIQSIFGPFSKKRFQVLGNDIIYCFQKE